MKTIFSATVSVLILLCAPTVFADARSECVAEAKDAGITAQGDLDKFREYVDWCLGGQSAAPSGGQHPQMIIVDGDRGRHGSWFDGMRRRHREIPQLGPRYRRHHEQQVVVVQQGRQDPRCFNPDRRNYNLGCQATEVATQVIPTALLLYGVKEIVGEANDRTYRRIYNSRRVTIRR